MCLGVPGQIESILGEGLERKAYVNFSGVKREVSLAFLPEAQVADYVIVHVGVAIARLDEEAAAKTLSAYLDWEKVGQKK